MAGPIPGYPRGNKGPVAPDSDPPPRERMPSAQFTETDEQTVKAFHAGHGRIGISIGANAIVAILTSGLTWLATHQPSTPVDCASKSELASVDKKVDTLSQDLGAIASKLNADSERMHNDIELIKVRVEMIRARQ